MVAEFEQAAANAGNHIAGFLVFFGALQLLHSFRCHLP